MENQDQDNSTTMMTVHKALGKLKMLEKKLDDLIVDGVWCAIEVGKDTYAKLAMVSSINRPNVSTTAEFSEKAKNRMDKVQSYLREYLRIKVAVITSNASTEVTIGGNKVTVAEAIVMKDWIKWKKDLAGKMASDYQQCYESVEKETRKKEKILEQRVREFYNKKEGEKITQEEMDFVSQQFWKEFRPTLVNPCNADKTIENLSKEVDDFYLNIDDALTVSNINTVIDIGKFPGQYK